MSGPLKDIKVLDLSRVLAGPYCTMILGDMGADVVKVEAPGGSDDTREWGPPYSGGESAYYFCANRNKRGMSINLKSESGREIIRQLVKDSDVVIHNFKNGQMEKWGLSYEDLKPLNEGLIYCAITGFGSTGPYQNLAGYDYIIQAMSGLMSITGNKETGPTKVGVAITDVLTGLYAAVGILGALHERASSGVGQSLDLALFDAQVSALVNVASNFLVSGEIPGLLGNQHPNIVPYQTFETADGEMVIAIGNDSQFRRFCKAIEYDELANDQRFETNPKRLENRNVLIEMIQEVMKTRTSKQWMAALNEIEIPCGPIQNLADLFQEEQIKAREMLVDIDHPTAGKIPLVGSPLKFSRTTVEVSKHPPLAGEHTEEILSELGFSASQINSLKKENII
ncbi:MAG TPA: CaiB/BaiF CoA-transferase family protein [Bacillales bacterium]|nr:CaiB/BaiF CoA-transferase family protein [Bacillales bacterium]